jgi:hypothetical protein
MPFFLSIATDYSKLPPGDREDALRGPLPMTCYRAVVLVSMSCFVCGVSQTAWAQAGTITPAMQNNCANDYKQFCGEYGLQTSALNLCMKKAGPKLSPACVRALVQAGKVSQAEVDRIKAQMKKGGS